MKIRFELLAALLLLVALPLAAQERSYKEGAVTVVTAVRVANGQMDNYTDYLSKTYKPVMDAQKKAGIVSGFYVYSTRARTPTEPNMYLVVTYPNMASFDGLDDRTEPVARAVTGESRAEAEAAGIKRGSMREILGSEIMRELELK